MWRSETGSDGARTYRSYRWQQQQHYQQPRARPTHFVAVRLISREIQRRVQQLQQWFVAKNPLFERCLVPLKRFHSALLLTAVDEARLQSAREACADAGSSIRDFLGGEPVRLVVSGIGHFGGRVLFARVRTEPPELLEAVHHLLSRSFMRHGFPVLDETGQSWLEQGEEPHRFGGHASFLKISKALAHARSEEERKALRTLHISEDDLASCKNTFFGTQVCAEFELLSMMGGTSDGYYPRLQLEAFQHSQPPIRSCGSSSAKSGATHAEVGAEPASSTSTEQAVPSLEQVLEKAWASGPAAEAAGSQEDQSTPPAKQQRGSQDDSAEDRAGGQLLPAHVMCSDVWSLAQNCLLLRDLLCLALAAREGLCVLRRAVLGVRVVLFSVGVGRSGAWEGSCADWDRRAGDGGDWPLELRCVDTFLYQQASSTISAEIGFAEDAQAVLFGQGLQPLQAAVCSALPKSLGQELHIEVDAIRNVSSVSQAVTKTLLEAQPRILGVEGLAADELEEWSACVSGMKCVGVLVHAWTDTDIADARGFFAALLRALPPDVWALDFQNMSLQMQDLPVALLPKSCVAFGTVVLQRDVNGCSARGSMAFADFLCVWPTFPRQVAIVRASLGTEGRWAHSPGAIAEALRCKFPGLAVLQLELSLKASASINDVPFVELARVLISMGVRVEVTNIRCRAVQYEFLRAALDHAGAAVHQLEDERPPAYPFSHPRYKWTEGSLPLFRSDKSCSPG